VPAAFGFLADCNCRGVLFMTWVFDVVYCLIFL
jgi:hypothetical protein